jgi:hypothetical protein
MTRIAIILASLALAGCPLNVNGNGNSGKDKSYKAGKKIELEDVGGGTFEGRSKKDIVTYPGGDRTDWKQFEIPAGANGELEVEVKYTAPRPGLDLAFDVYDQWGRKRGGAKPSKKKDKSKSDKIKNVEPGPWYVRVYASNRGDAGSYRVNVAFSPYKVILGPDATKLLAEIPDPPTLPAPIEPKKMTPEEKAKCEAEFKKCEEDRAKCEAANAASAGSAPQPVKGRIVGSQLDSSGMVIITIDKGKKHKIDRGWTGQVLAGGNPMPGGDFTVISVKESISVGKVKLTMDQVKANSNVVINPPAGAIVGPIACKECIACPIQ